jgi:hypothetical protein
MLMASRNEWLLEFRSAIQSYGTSSSCEITVVIPGASNLARKQGQFLFVHAILPLPALSDNVRQEMRHGYIVTGPLSKQLTQGECMESAAQSDGAVKHASERGSSVLARASW